MPEAPFGTTGRDRLQPTEQLLCCQSPLQGPSLPSDQADPQRCHLLNLVKLPGHLLGLSNSCWITKGTCCVPTVPSAWSYPLLCFDCEIPLSLGMNQFSHSVAMVGFHHLRVPKELSVGQAKVRHGMQGGGQHKNGD